MRNLLWLYLCGCCFGAATLTAGVIQFQVTPLSSTGDYHYFYSVSGFSFQANQELDIQFPAATSSLLRNGTAPSGFLVNLFQPNNPPGVQGDYSALATVNNPSTAAPFGVDFKYSGAGQPGSQPYMINQFDANGNFVQTLASGQTTPLVSGVPEPASVSLAMLGLIAGGASWAGRRRKFNKARV